MFSAPRRERRTSSAGSNSLLRAATRSGVVRNSPQSDALELLRGASALAVVLGHIRALLFKPYEELASPGLITQVWYLLTGFGHQAVMVFFVLSGLLIAQSVDAAESKQGFKWRPYILARAKRLYPTLLVALVVGGLIDRLGLHFFSGTDAYHYDATNVILSYDIRQALSIGTLVGNLLFLQSLHVQTLGSNGALWSLSYEWWYYLLFPLGLIGWRRRRGQYLLPLVAICVLVGPAVLTLFPVWLLGSSLHFLPKLRVQRSVFVVPVAAAALLAAIGLTRFASSALPGDYLVGLATAILIYVLLSSPHLRVPPFMVRPSRWLALTSYSLYALHLPLLVFTKAVLLPGGEEPPSIKLAGLVGVSLLLAYIAAAAVSGLLTSHLPGQQPAKRRGHNPVAGYS